MGKQIIMLLAVLFLGIGGAKAQTEVTGTIVDEQGDPVVGAAVKVVGTHTGAVTDLDGKFSISVQKPGASLEVSYIGMKSETVKAARNLHVVLHTDGKELDEVMVVAYGTTKKSAYTGAASEIKAEKLEDRQMSNVSSALTGTMAGVQTRSTNGQPGQDLAVRVRGISSINGVSAPLYVVDGVPFDGDLSSINTNDIESINVLKDAVSTSLYGSRGANGVVMITTKKGKEGKAKITVDAKWGSVSREVPNYKVLGNAASYYETLYQGYYNGYKYNSTSNYTDTQLWQLANADVLSRTGYRIYTVPDGQYLIGKNGKLNPEATLGYSDGTNYYIPDNWSDATFQNTLRQEYNASISGATDRINYFSSFGYLDDEGTIKGSGFKRFTTRTNVDYKVRDWLTIGTNLSYTHTNSFTPDEQDSNHDTSSGNAFYIANNIAPIFPLYIRNADGSIKYDNNLGTPVYDYGDGVYSAGSRNWMSMANPLADLTYNMREYSMDIFSGNWYAKLDLTHGFTFTARLGLNSDNTIYHNSQNANYGQSSNYGGQNTQMQTRTTALTHQYLLKYNNSFGLNNLDLTAGFEGYRLKVEDFYAYGQNLYRRGDYTVGNTIDSKYGSGEVNEYMTAGFFFSGNYNYDNRFFVNFGYRHDGTSAFAKDNRWGDFYNFGLGWNLKKEAWLQDVDAVDQLKVRASFGQTGNDNHNMSLAWSSPSYATWYAYADQYTVSGADGVFTDGTLAYKGNADLKWEKTNAFDFGADFSFFKGRLTGALDFYYRATSNLLDRKNVSLSNGYSYIYVNAGTVQNYGLEFEANYNIIQKHDLTWAVNFNGTFQKNRIKSLNADYDNGRYINGSYIYREGESIYNMYLTHYEGVDPETGLALYTSVKMDEDGTPVKDADGNYIEESTTDWSNAYNYNRKESGSLLPKFFGGLGTTLKWKGFDFAFQTSFQLGGRIYDAGYQDLMATGGTAFSPGQNWHQDILNAWTPENTTSNIPRVDVQDSYANSTSDRWLISSDYFSIDNLTIGYTLPLSWTKNLGIESLRIFGAAENLALFSARQGLDPRMSYTMASTSWYTSRRTISGGIKIVF